MEHLLMCECLVAAESECMCMGVCGRTEHLQMPPTCHYDSRGLIELVFPYYALYINVLLE